MRFVTSSGRARTAQASLGTAMKAGLWAASLCFAAAPALAAESFKEAAVTSGGFRAVPKANDEGAASEIAAANNPVSAPAGTSAGTVADVAGRYAILRGGGKDTGCLLTLDDKTRGPHGSFKAILAPGCSDQGILIFDPVGWEIAGGHLALIARKGHKTHLDKQPDGSWSKDPKEGQPLGLMKR
jgi:hypothetical protein